MVKWASSDDAIVTVNENGMITAHQVGEAVITAVTDSGSSESCIVTVIAAKPIKIESCTWNSQTGMSIVTFKLAPDFQLSPRNIRIYAAAYDKNQAGKMTRVYTGVVNNTGDSATFQEKIGNDSGIGSETWKIFLTDLEGKPICKAMTLGL